MLTCLSTQVIDKAKLKGIHKQGCRCYERLNSKTERSNTGLSGGKGDLRIGKRIGDKRFIRKTVTLVRMLTTSSPRTLDLRWE